MRPCPELVRLEGAAEGQTRFLNLYASALEEWAGRLGMDPLQLNKLVPTGNVCRGTVPSRTERIDQFREAAGPKLWR